MELSISIASYNTREVTCETLASLLAKTAGVDFEVIVVDNASTDGSAEMIASRFPSVRLIRSDCNLGFAAAHNQALSEASGDYLMVLNSDVLFSDNAVKRMVEDLRTASPAVGVVGPQVLNSDGSLAPSSRRRIFYPRFMVGLSVINQYFPFGQFLPMGFLRRRAGLVLGKVHDNLDPPRSAQEVEWLDGMCVLFKRAALEQAGLFDEQFFFDYEIGDLLVRVQAKGWRLLFVPGIKIIHLGGHSRKKSPYIRVDNQRSQLIYYAKHRPEYVSLIRRVALNLIGLKLRLLKLQLGISVDHVGLRDRVQILEMTRDVYLGFEPNSVLENAKIPCLGVSVGPLS